MTDFYAPKTSHALSQDQQKTQHGILLRCCSISETRYRHFFVPRMLASVIDTPELTPCRTLLYRTPLIQEGRGDVKALGCACRNRLEEIKALWLYLVYFKLFDLTFAVYTIKKHNSNAQKIIAPAMLLVNGVKSQAG